MADLASTWNRKLTLLETFHQGLHEVSRGVCDVCHDKGTVGLGSAEGAGKLQRRGLLEGSSRSEELECVIKGVTKRTGLRYWRLELLLVGRDASQAVEPSWPRSQEILPCTEFLGFSDLIFLTSR